MERKGQRRLWLCLPQLEILVLGKWPSSHSSSPPKTGGPRSVEESMEGAGWEISTPDFPAVLVPTLLREQDAEMAL